ncbi:MAG: TonB family protein [Burkholderiales bacterium]|jgi:protein TonB|nr:TonB family protein [Polynucleobacter sp.]MCX7244348.1 TonB family protein [Burkholderiales bacterium]
MTIRQTHDLFEQPLSFGVSLKQACFRRPFWCALIVSIVLHALFLSFRWSWQEVQNRRLNTALSVVLVNASSQSKPKKVQQLAQADLQGGSSTLPPQQASAIQRARLGSEAQLEILEKQQKKMLAQLDAERKQSGGRLSGEVQTAKSQLNALEAELAQRLQNQGSDTPRRAILTASNAKAVVFAQYYDAMRKKIEAYGSAFFPRANGRPIYGSLILLIRVDASGHLLKTGINSSGIEISRSSGIAELDRQALAIVRAAAPFGAFSPEMLRQLDGLDMVATFEFTRDASAPGLNRLELNR